MLTRTNYTVDTAWFPIALEHLPNDGMKLAINEPTGNFFYDPWKLKEAYIGTIWQRLYDSIPVDKGEARIIVLNPGQCYQSHADIDDRYHLNISGTKSYIVDLENNQMHFLAQNGIWYDMDAGSIHSATNFGRTLRVQLVIRKLLLDNKLQDPLLVNIGTTLDNLDHSRYLFDNTVSSWLNMANKKGYICNFAYTNSRASFNIEKDMLPILKNILPQEFILE